MSRKTTKKRKENSGSKGLRKIKIYKFVWPFSSYRVHMASLSKNFDFNLRRDHQKNFLWASRLWVGRRKEPILGYVPKNYEKENSGSKGLRKIKIYKFVWPFSSYRVHMASLSKNFDFNLRRDHQKNFLWASRLWVGRQKEPILGYVPKNYEKEKREFRQ